MMMMERHRDRLKDYDGKATDRLTTFMIDNIKRDYDK